MNEIDKLYKKYVQAREAAWAIRDQLAKYGIDLTSNAYQKAVKRQQAAYSNYVEAAKKNGN